MTADCGRAALYAAEVAAFDGTDLESVMPFAEVAAVIDAVARWCMVAGRSRASRGSTS
jgi:hypothetical protein